MKILITGSNGFVGSKLIHKFDDLGHEVIGIDNNFETNYEIHHKTINADLALNNLEDLLPNDIELIIHCAAAKSDFGISYDEYYKDNVIATSKLMDFAITTKVPKVIYYSTVSVYGHDNILKDENQSLNSNTVYGDTKLGGEYEAKRWVNKSNKYKLIILRPSVIYGINNFTNMYNLINSMKNNKFFKIGQGNHIKSMVSINNLIEMTLFVFNSNFDSNIEIFNCIDKPYLSVNNLMKIIAKEKKFNMPFIPIPIWLAYVIISPFELLSKITSKDFKYNWNRVSKFCKATDYRSEKIYSLGYIQKFSTSNEIKTMINWYNKIN